MQVIHAIIGCGRIAPNHFDGFTACPISEVRWICDRDPQALATAVGQFGIKQATLDYKEVLADPTVHSVSISVDHAQHALLTRDALLAGKHVLVEKPLSLYIEEALELVELACAHGLILSVVSQHRYDPLVKLVKDILNDGALGHLISIWTTFQCHRAPEYYTESYWRGTWLGEGGSVLMNQAYHCVDLMCWLGGPIRQVEALMDTLRLNNIIETEDALCALLRFQNRALGSISITSASAVSWRTRMDIVCTNGSLCFDIDHPDTLHYHHVPEPVEDQIHLFLEQHSKRPEPPPGKDYYGISHRYQIDEFARAIGGGGAVGVSGFESIPTLDTILKIYEAARATIV